MDNRKTTTRSRTTRGYKKPVGRIRTRPSPAQKTTHKTPEELTDASRGQRLQKVLAQAGVASRRECETLITEGHVTVNNKLVAAMPAWVDPTVDRIKVDGRPIAGASSKRDTKKKIYVIVNKPKGVVSTSRDPDGRTCVTDLVDLPVRLFPVGRLDADSTADDLINQ